MSDQQGSLLLNDAEQQKWVNRLEKLKESREVAGLLRGWIPAGYHDSDRPRILYVGKTTSGEFYGNETEEKYFNFKRDGGFWSFARKIARSVNCDENSLTCIAWSNISKISFPQVKAESSLVTGFEDQAAATLQYEIEKTSPHIVVFVSGHFCDAVVCNIAEANDDSQWNRSENESATRLHEDVWWRRKKDGIAVLWMRHPLGAPTKKLEFAAQKVASLCLTTL